MTYSKIPILNGTRWTSSGPDYTDHATCGALLGWCWGELRKLIAAGGPFRETAYAFEKLEEARVWDPASVRAAVDCLLEAAP